MGIAVSRPDYEIIVKTGDVKGAGTDANVYCVLVSDLGERSKQIKLDCKWRDDFEKGSIDNFKVANEPFSGNIEKIELWRDETGLNDDWFLEYIKARKIEKGAHLRSPKSRTQPFVPFPFNRWVVAGKKHILLKYDSILPQFDERKEQRINELEKKKKTYAYQNKMKGVPRRIEKCPRDENFSNDYQWDIVSRKAKLLAQKKLTGLFTGTKWKNLNDLLDVYKGSFGVPYGYYNWKSDVRFGKQRLRGCTPTTIRLFTEVPENFQITDEMISPLIGGLTINEAIEKKLLYYIDLSVLDGIICRNERTLCSPLALFYEEEGDLMPIAIQLKCTPGEKNPVFLPTDPEYTWMLAKMHFNNAECSLHQTITHLGCTHLVCESICIAVHQTLSPSHPVFRLLAPHFLYLIAINSLAVEKLLAPDGWIDITMTMGVKGLFQILQRRWKDWRFDTAAWLPNELKERGVEDTSRLKGYVYREDALLIHDAILKYVTEVLSYVYDTPEKIKDDYEIQNFAALLVDVENGAGIKGVFGDGKFEILDDLIKVISGTIFLCSVAHAAANFCQYDEYAFPANYPALLNGPPPNDKSEKTEQDILNQLPNKDTTLSIMVVTKILSERGTNGLGDFEIQYQYEPNAVRAVERFRANLRDISNKIKARNNNLKEPYPYLDPDEVPNAISI